MKLRRPHDGRSKHPLFQTYVGMMSRCYRPSTHCYEIYGGRGIQVCERWRDDFFAFAADMGDRPSPEHQLDRIDNDGHYEASNCRWATPLEQSRNRGNNIWCEFEGQRKTLGEWAEVLDLPYRLIYKRVAISGWPPELAFKTPSGAIRRGGRRKKLRKSVCVLAVCARNPAWKGWVDDFAANEGKTLVGLIDAALATYAALRRYPPPPDREA